MDQRHSPRSNGGSAAGVASATTARPVAELRPVDTTDVPTSFEAEPSAVEDYIGFRT